MADGWDEVLKDLAKNMPVKEIYVDGLQGAVREVGKAATDVAKGSRLLAAPFQLLAAYSARFDRWCERIENAVPEQRRIPIEPSIGGPLLETLRFHADGELLTEMMLNLLTASVDRDQVSSVHPDFPGIIRRLSRDEAVIVHFLKKSPMSTVERSMHNPAFTNSDPSSLESHEFPADQFIQPQLIKMYLDRLEHLGLIQKTALSSMETIPAASADGRTGTRMTLVFSLNQFGKMFALACMPEELPPLDKPLHSVVPMRASEV